MESKEKETTAVRKKPGPKPKATTTTEAPEAKAKPSKPVRLEDHVLISTRSNQFGGLVFVNSRTNERFVWTGIDDIQELSVADIRDMRSTARRFFEEPWIVIEGVETPGYEDMTREQILQSLNLTRYYDKSKRPDRLSDAMDWDVETIRLQVPNMTRDTKDNLAIAVTDAVRNGDINALDRIRAWEEVLGTSFLSTSEQS